MPVLVIQIMWKDLDLSAKLPVILSFVFDKKIV